MVSNKESAVIFCDIEEMYSFNEDLVCTFIPNHYTPQDGDRVAMFKLGWKSVKDYILFEWAPTGLPETMEHKVIFDRYDLPQNVSEIYQICYISSENVLHGATIPFQFQSEIPQRNSSIKNILNSSYNDAPLILSSCQDILKSRRIKREIENLEKDALSMRMSKSFSCENSESKLGGFEFQKNKSIENFINSLGISKERNHQRVHAKCERQIAELKHQIELLRRKVAMQQNEINTYKSEKEAVGQKPVSRKHTTTCFKEIGYDLGELDPIPPFPLNL
ncbi:hypothetical protein HHI36_015971 [Cryptolaemus montrouzieri]|uniref:SKICH domain-containing protein n=1 Tax=Cryptolaemus montrouzieri TaxID=559131 RepID=A0ABD2N732_9CUCU